MKTFRKPKPVAKNCPFCAAKTVPDYKDISTLYKYLTERGKIMGVVKTGLCSRHQKDVTHSIKYARHVALLPFVVRA